VEDGEEKLKIKVVEEEEGNMYIYNIKYLIL
jgi:hypothetical protein